jgi:hypothetical protein
MSGSVTPVSVAIGFDISKLKAGIDMAKRQLNELAKWVNKANPQYGYEQFHENIKKLLKAGGISFEEAKKALYEYARAHNVSTPLVEKWNAAAERKIRAEKDIRDIVARNTTDREKYNAGMARASELYREHNLSLVHYRREVARLNAEWGKSKENMFFRAKQAIMPAGALKGIMEFAAPGLVVAGVTKSLNLAAETERAEVAFEVMTKNAGAAKNLVREMRELDRITVVSFRSIQKAGQMMLGYGVSLRQVMPSLHALSEISMGDEDRFRGLSLAFSQVAAQGRMAGQEVIQFVNAGFNPLQEISKKTGKSMSELLNMMEKRMITFDMMREAIMGVVQEGGRFHEMNIRMQSTLTGAYSRVVAAITQLGIAIGNALAPHMMVIADIIESIVGSSAQMVNISAQLSNINGGAFFGGKVPSFAGGGITPPGARAGGVDGQGGFPAILHPNEAVIDMSNTGQTSLSWAANKAFTGWGMIAAYSRGEHKGMAEFKRVLAEEAAQRAAEEAEMARTGTKRPYSIADNVSYSLARIYDNLPLVGREASFMAEYGMNELDAFTNSLRENEAQRREDAKKAQQYQVDSDLATKKFESITEDQMNAYLGNVKGRAAARQQAPFDFAGSDQAVKAYEQMLDDAEARYDASFFDASRTMRERTKESKTAADKAALSPLEKVLYDNRAAFEEMPDKFKKSIDGKEFFKQMNKASKRQFAEEANAGLAGELKALERQTARVGANKYQSMQSDIKDAFSDLLSSGAFPVGSKANTDLVELMFKQLDQVDKLQEAEKFAELANKAKDVKESQKTPQEKLNERIAEITEMFSKRLLTIGEARKEMEKAVGDAVEEADPGTGLAPAIIKGTREALEFDQKITKDALNEAKVQTKVQKKTNELLRGILNRPVLVF